MKHALLITHLALLCPTLFGQTTNPSAPGAPGMDAHWLSAAKNGFGTSNSLSSKIWFTLSRGVLTEVFYPTLDTPNVQSLQLIVVTDSRVETEIDDMIQRLEVPDSRSLTFRQINRSKKSDFTISKTYVTDPANESLLIDLQYHSSTNSSVYLHFDPSLNNSGRHDTAWSSDDALLATDAAISSALVSNCGFVKENSTNGYLGTSDGLTQLRKEQRPNHYERASDGNVVQVAKLEKLSTAGTSNCTIALGFGENAQQALSSARKSLRRGFRRVLGEYQGGWHGYAATLPNVGPKYQAQFNMSAMVLRALEDKKYRGAMIASPSNPWGAGPNANEPTTTGYHAVWSRDLYHVATAFLAMGDRSTANRALDFLFRIQQKPDGSFPQNSRVDGRLIGEGLQMDQVAYPLVLAYQLRRNDRQTWLKHVKPAADFILQHGPLTEQERWEEERGYSPATIAAEIAGLVCAADIARVNRDRQSEAAYLKKADEWAKKVETWTATSTGQSGHYYLRVTENADPNDGAVININSGGGDHDERDIVDAGFLELVRFGVKPANDPLIRRSLAIVDRMIKLDTKNGAAWYRYNKDGYGERDDGGGYDGRSGRGRPWPLLTGERGEYELALGNKVAARLRLDALLAFANEGRMIPEQIWDKRNSPQPHLQFGEGTGSATPLGWAMAQFIRLVMNIRHGRNLETPTVVAARYHALRRG